MTPVSDRHQVLLRAAALALGAAVSLGLARFAYALLLPAMRADLGWSYFTAGAMNMVNAAGYLLGALLMPRWLRAGSPQVALVGGGLASAALLAAHGIAQSDAALYALRLATGVASAATFVSGGLLAARLANRAVAVGIGPGLVLGLYYGGTGLGIVASALLLPGFIGDGGAVGSGLAGWQSAWLALGGLALALSLLMAWGGESASAAAGGAAPVSTTAAATPSDRRAPGSKLVQNFAWALAGYFMFGLGYIGYMTFAITLLREQHLAPSLVTAFFVLLGLGVLASPWLWAGLMQRHRDGRPLALLNALLALATLAPVLSPHPALAFASGALFGSVFLSLVASTTLGNPAIKPEVMNEREYGVDAAMFRGRVSLESSHYERLIKDLLVTFPLPASSGLVQQTINGGQLSARGIEAGLNIVPISNNNMEWTFRTTYQHNVQNMDELKVPAFAVPGSFGSAYGRNRIAVGTRPTYIWGNIPFSCLDPAGTGSDGKACHRIYPGDAAVAGSVVRDSIIADANPIGQVSFLNSIRYKRFTVTGLVDWRIGGYTADMTKNLFDEGGNSRDFDAASPVSGTVMGDFRYGNFSAGNIAPYIDVGSFVKLREVNVSFDAPRRWADVARARDMRVSVQGRNLWTKSNYWSFDPEFNNFGNSNFNRFIDLAPYPSNRQFFFSVDLGY